MLGLGFCPSARPTVDPPAVRHFISPNEETLSASNGSPAHQHATTALIDEASVQRGENCPSGPPEHISLSPMSAPWSKADALPCTQLRPPKPMSEATIRAHAGKIERSKLGLIGGHSCVEALRSRNQSRTALVEERASSQRNAAGDMNECV